MAIAWNIKSWTSRLGLTAKFNVILVTVFTVAFAFTGLLTDVALKRKAHQEVLDRANLIMDTANAVRKYTVDEVRPVLGLQMKESFIPQAIPFYSAIQAMRKLTETNPEYTYRETSKNPTNPKSRAVDWEADIIEFFRKNPDQPSVIGMRKTAAGDTLYLARSIFFKDKACLNCHSSPDIAPQTVIAAYGSSNGFGYKQNDLFGMQIVSVPATFPLQQARDTFYVFMGSILAIFVFIMIVLNILLRYSAILPISGLARIMDHVSRGKTDVPEFVESGKDEITVLAASFNRLRRSLDRAMKMLEK